MFQLPLCCLQLPLQQKLNHITVACHAEERRICIYFDQFISFLPSEMIRTGPRSPDGNNGAPAL